MPAHSLRALPPTGASLLHLASQVPQLTSPALMPETPAAITTALKRTDASSKKRRKKIPPAQSLRALPPTGARTPPLALLDLQLTSPAPMLETPAATTTALRRTDASKRRRKKPTAHAKKEISMISHTMCAKAKIPAQGITVHQLPLVAPMLMTFVASAGVKRKDPISSNEV